MCICVSIPCSVPTGLGLWSCHEMIPLNNNQAQDVVQPMFTHAPIKIPSGPEKGTSKVPVEASRKLLSSASSSTLSVSHGRCAISPNLRTASPPHTLSPWGADVEVSHFDLKGEQKKNDYTLRHFHDNPWKGERSVTLPLFPRPLSLSPSFHTYLLFLNSLYLWLTLCMRCSSEFPIGLDCAVKRGD